MTRNRKVDHAVLEREYIYDANTPPVSFTEMADKYGVARNTVAEMGRKGRWFERRQEFRKQMGEKVIAALGDQWVEFETATRERLMHTATAFLDQYDKALASGDIKPTTRDMLGVASMLRTFMADVASSPTGKEALIDPESAPVDAEFYRHSITSIDRLLESGDRPDEPGPAGETEATGS